MNSKKAAISFTILDEFTPKKPTKSERRRLQLIEQTITLLALSGIEKTTHESVAEACGVSRSLVHHYFPEREELILLAMRFIRARFQKLCVDAISAETDPTGQLKAYIESACSWVDVTPHDARVWILFYYNCGVMKKYRSLNTELVQQGHLRIMALLEQIEEGSLKKSEISLSDRAKLIQNSLTGYFLSSVTEDLEPSFKTTMIEATLKQCLAIAGIKL